MSRRPGYRHACHLVLLITLAALLIDPPGLAFPVRAEPTCAMPQKPHGLRPASVVRVVDGDTIIVDSVDRRNVRVRLIGIDSPEVHQSEKLRRDSRRSGKDPNTIRSLGAKASEFTKKHLGSQRIEMELDIGALDRYGRTLAYVWLRDELYNVVIVREGYAALMTIPPNVKYAELFAGCYRIAREHRRGLWALDDIAAGTTGSDSRRPSNRPLTQDAPAAPR